MKEPFDLFNLFNDDEETIDDCGMCFTDNDFERAGEVNLILSVDTWEVFFGNDYDEMPVMGFAGKNEFVGWATRGQKNEPIAGVPLFGAN